MFYKGHRQKQRKKRGKMNMIEEHRSVQKDGTLDLRGFVHIKNEEYINNILIKTIIIGSSFQKIGEWAFAGCRNVEEIIFEEPCQITKLEEGCFAHCFNLRKIDLPSSIQEIEDMAFVLCPLERVILRGPCHIGEECFRTNALTYFHVANSIQKLNEKAFYQNAFSSFSKSPCKIYIRPEFHDKIKRMFQGRTIEFIGNELEEGGYVLK